MNTEINLDPPAGDAVPNPIDDFISGGLDEVPTDEVPETIDTPPVEVLPNDAPPTDTPPTDTPPTDPPAAEDDFGSPFELDTTPDTPAPTTQTDEEFEAEVKEETVGMDAKAGAKWKDLKAKLRAANTQVASLQENPVDSAQLDEYKAKVTAYEEMETEYKALQKEAALNDYTKTPEYDTEVRKPYIKIQDLSQSIEEANGLEAGSIMTAITKGTVEEQDLAISELEDKVNTRALATIHTMANQVTMLYGREQSIQSNAETLLKEYNDKQEGEMAVQSEKDRIAFSGNVDSTFEQFKAKIPSLVDESGNNSTLYDGMLSKAKSLNFSDMDGDSKAFAAMAAVLLPSIVSQLNQSRTEVNDLKALTDQYRGATPKPNGGGNAPNPQGGQVTPESILNQFIG